MGNDRYRCGVCRRVCGFYVTNILMAKTERLVGGRPLILYVSIVMASEIIRSPPVRSSGPHSASRDTVKIQSLCHSPSGSPGHWSTRGELHVLALHNCFASLM